MDKKTRFFQMIKSILPSVELNSTIRRLVSTDSRPKWVKNTLTKEEEHCIMNSVQGEYTEPVLPAVTALGMVISMMSFSLNFYRIEIFLNSDDTMDAFLYWRIPEGSTYRAKYYGCDDRWDIIAAKLDLLADGLTYRELIRRVTKCSDHYPTINDHLNFTLVGDCPALDDIAYTVYVDSDKVMDIYFDDGCSPSIRCILNAEYINGSDPVARFVLS